MKFALIVEIVPLDFINAVVKQPNLGHHCINGILKIGYCGSSASCLHNFAVRGY